MYKYHIFCIKGPRCGSLMHYNSRQTNKVMPRLCKSALKTLKCLCWSFLENNLSSFKSLNPSTLLSVIVGDSFANNCAKKGLHKEDNKISMCLSMTLMIGTTICCTGKVVGDGKTGALVTALNFMNLFSSYIQRLHRQEAEQCFLNSKWKLLLLPFLSVVV